MNELALRPLRCWPFFFLYSRILMYWVVMAMMLRFSFGMTEAADAIDAAVKATIDAGYRTGDIFSNDESTRKVNTVEMGDAICGNLG